MIETQLEVHGPSYKQLGTPLPRPMQDGMQPGWVQAVADTGSQLDIIGSELVLSMGIKLGSLFPVLTRIFGATRPAKVDIARVILLTVSDPLGLTSRQVSPHRFNSFT